MFASLLQFSNKPSGKPACLLFILQDSAFSIAILPDSISPCDYKMTLLAFLHLGYYEEARAWGEWLLRAAAGSPRQVQILCAAFADK